MKTFYKLSEQKLSPVNVKTLFDGKVADAILVQQGMSKLRKVLFHV